MPDPDYSQMVSDQNAAPIMQSVAPPPADYASSVTGWSAPSVPAAIYNPNANPNVPLGQGGFGPPNAFPIDQPTPIVAPFGQDPRTSDQRALANLGPAPKPTSSPSAAAAPSAPIHFDQPAAVAPGAGQSTWHPSAAPTGGGGGGGANPLLKDFAEEKNILATGAEQAAQERMGEIGMQQNMGTTIEANAADNKARADKALQDQQGQMEELRQQQEVAQNFHLDPNRYMKKQNFLQSGLMGIAASLNSISKAFLHQGGPNEVMEQLNKNIERDIDAQKQDYETMKQKGQDAQNLYAMNLKATGSHDDALKAAQIQGLDAQKNYMLAAAGRTNNANLITNAKLAGNAIDQKVDTLKAQQAAAASAAAAAKAAEQEKQFKEFSQKNVEGGRFKTVDEAQNAAHQTVYGRQQGDTSQAPILVKDPNAGATYSADQDLKQAQGLNRVGQEALGSYGASLTLPGSDLRAKDAKAQEYDEGMVAQLEAKGYSARQARAKVEHFTISGHPEGVQKERLAAWQDANQNGLFPRIKKGAGGGTEPDETP